MSGGGERDGDDDVALRQLSQDQGRLPLVRSLYSPIVSPEQALWTQWSPFEQGKAYVPFLTCTEQIPQGQI